MNEKKICLIASSNKDKISELKSILDKFNFQIVAPYELGDVIEIEENADTFVGNSNLKAFAYHKLYPDYYILADDSGLCVDALDGEPGVYSARYAGENSTYDMKFNKIWQELKKTGVSAEKWSAKFICAISWYEPRSDEPKNFIGEFSGRIINEARGEKGFGYDPIFYLPEYEKTAAELSSNLKNSISHRAKALKKLENYLKFAK